LWLLLPRHPSNFLWYLSPANADTEHGFAILDGIRNYARWLVEDYHNDLQTTILAITLCVIGLLSWRRLRPGGSIVFWVVVLATCLTITHPNHKGRCLHSWIATVWIAAGIGTSSVAYCCRPNRWPGAGNWIGMLSLAALTWTQVPALRSVGHALEGGPKEGHPSMLDVTDSYVPEIARSRRATVLAAVPFRTLTQWAVLECLGRLDRLEEHWWDFSAESPSERDFFLQWLRTTDCDTLVFLERLPGKLPWVVGPECDRHSTLLRLLRNQDQFTLVRKHTFEEQHCRVLVWRRQADRPGYSPASGLTLSYTSLLPR
jgi:hypothetical protein